MLFLYAVMDIQYVTIVCTHVHAYVIAEIIVLKSLEANCRCKLIHIKAYMYMYMYMYLWGYKKELGI